MAKGVSIMTIICLCLIFGIGVKSPHAEPPINPTDMQEQMKKHVDDVKLKNPQKYQEMVQRAGGNITKCTDCHKEVIEGNHHQPEEK